MMRLSPSALQRLPAAISIPHYDRGALGAGIVHLGVGAFFRAHGAVYTEAAVRAGDHRWGIIGASLRSPDIRDALASQDYLYTVASREDESEALQVIGTLRGMHVAPEDPQALLAAMNDPRVAIVSTTVTEKGYCLDPGSGALDEAHPDVAHDLAQPHTPRSAIGFIVEALARRQAEHKAGFTVLCCDNLFRNGETLGSAVRRFASLRDPALARFIEDNVTFPSTMLDRIVPATTAEDRTAISKRLGVDDAAPVVAERHNRWVIEDRFIAGRPRWEDVGVEMVADVAPYEAVKLKLLNASHSALAYLGYLAGHETIADASNDPVFLAFINTMTEEEVIPTLRLPTTIDARGFRDQSVARFRNRAIHHRTWQIAMDGSQKLPPRLLGTIRDRLAAGAPFPHLALAVAGWMRYVAGTGERGQPIDVRDPLAHRFQEIAQAAGSDTDTLARGLITIPEIFGTDLPARGAFISAVTESLRMLYALGARGAAQAIAQAR